MAKFSTEDHQWMAKAIELAARGRGLVEPNPMVGCVLVKDGLQLGEGYHQRFGGPHAEVEALRSAASNNSSDVLAGATAYVTLEPCCHFGKTPPCTDALIAARVKRVVVATGDPHAVVAGGGLVKLRDAGIAVDVGLLDSESRELNAPYFKRIRSNRPWVIAKWAMSLDGKIATRTGHSQWISSDPSRQWVHQLRGRVDAVMVGIGTALADDPMLDARPPGPRRAMRVVVDSCLRLPVESKLAQSSCEHPVLVCAGPQADPIKAADLDALGCKVWISALRDRQSRLDELLQLLAQQYGVTNLMVEGGSQLLGGLFDLQQIDQCEVFIAPKLVGGQAAPSPIAGLGLEKITDGRRIDLVESTCREQDMHLTYRLRWDDRSENSTAPVEQAEN